MLDEPRSIREVVEQVRGANRHVRGFSLRENAFAKRLRFTGRMLLGEDLTRLISWPSKTAWQTSWRLDHNVLHENSQTT